MDDMETEVVIPNVVGMASKVPEAQIRKAVVALQKWKRSSSKTKQQDQKLVEDEDMVYLVVALKRIPEAGAGRTSGIRIPLPHSLYPLDSGKEVCLIVKDEDKEGRGDAKVAKARILEGSKDGTGGGSGVSKVLSVSKLRKSHSTSYEARRKLCGSFDIFLADERVIPMLPRLLGKSFFKKKKQPVPVKLTGKDWAGKIRQACDSTYLFLGTPSPSVGRTAGGGGSCVSVRVARFSQSEEDTVRNIQAAIAGVVEKVPKKWRNIQSLFLKADDSAALPLYHANPGASVEGGGGVPTRISSGKDSSSSSSKGRAGTVTATVA